MATKTMEKEFILENHRLKKYRILEFAKHVLKIKLWKRQKKILREFYDSGKQELLLVCGKKSSKTFMASVIALYEVYLLLLLGNPQQHYEMLSNQPIYMLNTCTGQKQAKKIFLSYVKSMIDGSDFLKLFLVGDPTSEEIRFEKNMYLMGQSSNSVSSLGYTCKVVLFDELAWFRDTAGNLSGKAVYDALSPNIKPFGKDGKRIIFSSPGAKTGIFYKIYLNAAKFKDTMVVQLATWEINPHITRESLDSEFKKDPLKARMDWGAEFVDVSGEALNSKKIDEAIKHDNLDVNNGNWENEYVIALDPGLKHDAFALGMGHIENNIVKIDLIHYWQGTSDNPVDIEEVENFIRFLCKNFNVKLIVLDQHQSASTIQRLSKEGHNIKETIFTATYNVNIYTHLIERLNCNQIWLPRVHKLISELKALKRIGAGKYAKYEAPTSGAVTHDDCADVVANCAYQLKQLYVNEENLGTDDFACDGEITEAKDKEEKEKEDKKMPIIKRPRKEGQDKKEEEKKEEEDDFFCE